MTCGRCSCKLKLPFKDDGRDVRTKQAVKCDEALSPCSRSHVTCPPNVALADFADRSNRPLGLPINHYYIFMHALSILCQMYSDTKKLELFSTHKSNSFVQKPYNLTFILKFTDWFSIGNLEAKHSFDSSAQMCWIFVSVSVKQAINGSNICISGKKCYLPWLECSWRLVSQNC